MYTRVGKKIMATARHFWDGFIHRGTTFMYLQYSRQIFGRRRTPSARPSLLMFSTDRPIARISSSLVLCRVPRSGSSTLAKRSYSHGLISGEYDGCSRISYCQRRKSSVRAATAWLLHCDENYGVLYHPSVQTCLTQTLKTFFCTTPSCHFNFDPEMLH